MNIRVEVSQSELERMGSRIAIECNKAKLPTHTAMTQRFYELVIANIGIAGVDRPSDWDYLSPAYARKVHREIATLRVTGALEAAIRHDDVNPARGVVSISDSDVPYATVHMWGGGNNIPPRPYFPIDANGEVLPYSLNEVVSAAQAAFTEAL